MIIGYSQVIKQHYLDQIKEFDFKNLHDMVSIGHIHMKGTITNLIAVNGNYYKFNGVAAELSYFIAQENFAPVMKYTLVTKGDKVRVIRTYDPNCPIEKDAAQRDKEMINSIIEQCLKNQIYLVQNEN